jgi:hypothetical protein
MMSLLALFVKACSRPLVLLESNGPLKRLAVHERRIDGVERPERIARQMRGEDPKPSAADAVGLRRQPDGTF